MSTKTPTAGQRLRADLDTALEHAARECGLMARVDSSEVPDDRSGSKYGHLPPVGTPEFEKAACEYWALPHLSPERKRYEPYPIEFYRWL